MYIVLYLCTQFEFGASRARQRDLAAILLGEQAQGPQMIRYEKVPHVVTFLTANKNKSEINHQE